MNKLFQNHKLKRVERALEDQHHQALDYAVRYRSRWDRVHKTHQRLWDFRQGVHWREEAAQTARTLVARQAA